jgi:Holliday junction resolvase RusA-like endonuclease
MDKITLFLPGYVVPKARPRVTRKGTFMPTRYREWRNSAEREILDQVRLQGLASVLPVERATVEILLTGKHRMSGDADNILGSYLDALVAVGVLKNDNLLHLPEVCLKFNPEGILGAVVNISVLPVPVKNTRRQRKISI